MTPSRKPLPSAEPSSPPASPPSSPPLADRSHLRVSSQAKANAVLRLLKGESAEAVSLDLGISLSRLQRWETRFVDAGSTELARRKDGPSQSWIKRHSDSIRDAAWFLLALFIIVFLIATFLTRS